VQEKRANLAQIEIEFIAACNADNQAFKKTITEPSFENDMAYWRAKAAAEYAAGDHVHAEKELQETLAKSATIRLLSSTLCQLRKTPHPLG
jgi:hypothetical protein